MPTQFVQGSGNVVVWINSAAGSDAGKSFQVKHLTAPNPPVLFEVREASNEVVVYGAFRKRGEHVIHYNDTVDATIATFQRGSANLISVSYGAADGVTIETPGAADADLVFKAAADVVLDSGNGSVVFYDASGGVRWATNENTANMMWNDGAGHQLMLWYGERPSGTHDAAAVEVGSGFQGFRGGVRVKADTVAGQPGILRLETAGGGQYFLWVRKNGRLHIHTDNPHTNDSLGTPVRDQ